LEGDVTTKKAPENLRAEVRPQETIYRTSAASRRITLAQTADALGADELRARATAEGVDLTGATSKQEVIERVRAWARGADVV
jgi:hypothetical protein